jgi:hypothetical protein
MGGYYEEIDAEEEAAELEENPLYSKSFVNAFFSFKNFAEARVWLGRWFKVLRHNPTEFTADLPALLDRGLEHRAELLAKVQADPAAAGTVMGPSPLMSQCILDHGIFADAVAAQNPEHERPTIHDYVLHLSLGLLVETCTGGDIPAIVPRIILNNLAIKLNSGEIVLEQPKHQQWGLHIFHRVRSDLIPDFIGKLKLGGLVNDNVLLDVTKRQLSNGKFNDAALMVVRYKFQGHFDIGDLMHKLVELGKIETAKMLVAQDDALKVQLIRALSNADNCKKAAQLIKDFHFSEDDFPEVKERIMKKSIRFYLSRSQSKKSTERDFMTLDRVEDLLSGFKQMLSYLVEDLVQTKRENEALGIMTRNQLQSFLKPETIAKMAQYNYDPQRDTSMSQEGEFAPVSQPVTDYLVLPESVKVEWIGTEADVPKLEALLAEPLIGVDSEWRPELTQYHRTRPSLLQVSGERTAFLIDLLSLQRSRALDETLSRVFRNEGSTVIGFGFSSDVDQFARKHPQYRFIKYVERFIDAQSYYGKVMLVEQQTGLAKVAAKLLGKSICKVEQISNWERRPLRLSQQHYAALDAYVLIEILKALIRHSEERMHNGPPVQKYIRTLDNRSIIVEEDAQQDDGGGLFGDEDFYEKETARRNKLAGDRGKVGHQPKGKHQKWQRKEEPQQRTYGNSYGRRGQTNNTSLITNDTLRASMWQTHGFIVDKNLTKLARML